MALIELENGELLDAADLNYNYNYLDDKIATVKTEITGGSSTSIASIASNMATIERNVGNGGIVPAGTIIMWGGYNTTPEGYLFCDGGSYSKSDYQSLFNAIQYTYGGSGDNFNVPNLADARYPVGWTTSGNRADNQYSAQTVYVGGNTGGQSANHHHPSVMGGPTNSSPNASDHYHGFSGSGTYYRTDQVKYITFRFCIKV